MPCPKCKAEIDRWPAPISPPAGAPGVVRVAPPVEPAVWHYSANGARRGPVTTAQLRSLVESGMLRASDLIWREGLPAWVEAGTAPDLFPAAAIPPPVPVSAPRPAPPPMPVAVPPQPVERDDRRSRSDDRPIQVTVNQVIERDEEDRRPRRRRGGFHCPYCGSTDRPIVRRQVSGAGWAVFVLLLLFTIVLCFIGLFIQEDVYHCRDCGARV